jgi:hypothetical protein
MKHVCSRVASSYIFVFAGGLGACSSATDTPLGEIEGDPRGAVEAQLGHTAKSDSPLPPPDYTVKWSTCTHYVEGSATLPNNTRIVKLASDGTVPLHRVEPVGDPETDIRRMTSEDLPNGLVGGEGLLRSKTVNSVGRSAAVVFGPGAAIEKVIETEQRVSFLQLGQVVTTEEAGGNVVQWLISSENLGEPIEKRDGTLEFQDTCFRNPNVVGRDTAGWVSPGTELAVSCVVEDSSSEYNAYSVYGWTPIVNYTTRQVPTANSPDKRPHPDGANYEGMMGSTHVYSGYGAALNDISGTERDPVTNYIPGEQYCHMIVNGGYEVPGAKRPATKSLPAPGIVNGATLIAWRPVNPNVIIANDQEPGAQR